MLEMADKQAGIEKTQSETALNAAKVSATQAGILKDAAEVQGMAINAAIGPVAPQQF